MLRSGRGSRRAGLALVAACLALALGACAGGGTGKKTGRVPTNTGAPVRATVHWDLRNGHSAKQVKWRGPSAVDLEGGVQVKLQLPGATFQDRVDRFGALNSDGEITDISLSYPSMKLAPAYARARRLAQAWKINTHPLDTWYATQKARPSPPADQADALATGFDPTGPGGPVPSVEITYSFDDANPNVVKLEFAWS